MSRLLKTLIAVGGTLGLGSLFWQAYLHPLQSLDFIYNGAIAFLLIELASLAGAIFLDPTAIYVNEAKEPLPNQWSQRLQTLMIVLFFGGLVPLFTGQYALLGMFLIGLISKVFAKSSTSGPVIYTLYAMVLITLFAAVFFADIIHDYFPLPEAVYDARPVDSEGSAVDYPEMLLAWGVVYYSLAALVELLFGLFWQPSDNDRPKYITVR